MQPLKIQLSSLLAASLLFTTAPTLANTPADTPTPKVVMEHYAAMAHAVYSDSLTTAKNLQSKIDAFLAAPSTETQHAAKQAWLAARVPYGQSEAFRFGNANVDAWEGQVNAWPLDEGLLDYVAKGSYEGEEGNGFATEDIIAGTAPITVELLRESHEKGGSEANVATGYHAIEFLLWGQDLNAKPEDAGLRAYTDYVQGEGCTNGHCDRRASYLKVVTDLLVSDLQTIVDDWSTDKANYRQAFLALEENEAVRRMLFGLGSLSLGELAGERMNVALLAHSQEDEHSCFSDNTHNDIVYNAQGIQNIYQGTYTRTDGTQLKGASLADLAAQKDPKANATVIAQLNETAEKTGAIAKAAQAGEHFDQQILTDNKDGKQRIKAAVASLRRQTAGLETVAKVLGVDHLNPETSDSLQ